MEGWTEDVRETPLELARNFDALGLSAVIYTDIQKDGMKTGPNIDATKNLANQLETPVIDSGGITNIHDVRALSQCSEHGIIGMITGRALYDGGLDLREAVAFLQSNVH